MSWSKEDKITLGFVVIWILGVLCALSSVIGAIYVIIHFILKAW